MFAYIAGAPFVFIDIFGLKPQQFGWLFAANASAVVLSAQVNGRVFHGRAPERLMRNAAFVQCAAGVMLTAVVLAGGAKMLLLALPLFLYLSCIGFVFPNAVAMALANHGKIAGMASALLGTLQFSMAATAVLILGAINSATAFPMSLTIFICGTLGVVTHLWLMRGAPASLPIPG
jgi:DHA1 family bicyclomycin/chloramphenicol resistance-like MFS transporter